MLYKFCKDDAITKRNIYNYGFHVIASSLQVTDLNSALLRVKLC